MSPLPAISSGSFKMRTSVRRKPVASRSRTTSSANSEFSNKPTAVFAILASTNQFVIEVWKHLNRSQLLGAVAVGVDFALFFFVPAFLAQSHGQRCHSGQTA